MSSLEALPPSRPRRITWSDPRERAAQVQSAGGTDAAARGDEFPADVARAMAALRRQHGLATASCTEPGNDPAALAALQADLRHLLPEVSRRGFMQLSGAAALFALAGCYAQHPDTLVPYAQQPEGTTLGASVFYSTTLRDSGRPVPVWVKTYDGRPIKIEGNADHPLSRGRCDLHTQAALLNLYDPDRCQQGPLQRSGTGFAPVSWSALDTAVGNALAKGRAALITGPVDGPATRQLVDDLISACGGRLQVQVVDDSENRYEVQAYGTPVVFRADRAALLVAFGGDFLGGGSTGLPEQIEFGDLHRLRGHGPHADLGQVICFEPTLSQLGCVADIRIRTGADTLAWVAWAVAARVATALGQPLPAGIAATLASLGEQPGQALGLQPIAGEDAIAATATLLLTTHAASRHSLIYAGGMAASRDQLPVLEAAAFLNQLLGNIGVTVDPAAVAPTRLAPDAAGLEALLADCAAGRVATLILAANIAHRWPDAVAKAAAGATTVVAIADRLDETAALAQWVAPLSHGLESWGDAEARSGLYSLQQPCIAPLFASRSREESLMAFAVAAGCAPASWRVPVQAADARQLTVVSRAVQWQAPSAGVKPWRDLLQEVWTSRIRTIDHADSDPRSFWDGALALGVVRTRPTAALRPGPVPAATAALPARLAKGSLALVISASRVMRDGRFLNNAWLQEIPDPVSKVTWDTYVALAARDARELGVAADQVVTITAGGRSIRLPVHIQEAQQPGTVEVFTGWGRRQGRCGAVADLGIVDGYSINLWPWVDAVHLGDPVSIAGTGTTYQLACTQFHQRMEGRDIAREDDLALFRRDPGAVRRRRAEARWKEGTDGQPDGRLSLYGSEIEYLGHKWGMSVDLSACIGCQACVVACSSENNVPVVGRDEVRKQRIMHWIRIDRYYTADEADGDLLDVDVLYQPVMCQQCGHAPCEEVCPAMATVHNDEGINVMVYNRCIGTRYCSNNCPYKVRRFNWYEYSIYRSGPIGSGSPLTRVVTNLITSGATHRPEELSRAPLQMLLNPTVTVRSRGVMEKCNFCIQRTREVREHEKETDQPLRDGVVTTACAQTCPTQAIVFGDLNDADSAVNHLAQDARGYRLLDEALNTRPAVTYLARIRNRPPDAAAAAQLAALISAEAAGSTAPAGGDGTPTEGQP